MDKDFCNRLIAKMVQEAMHDSDWRSLLKEMEIEQVRQFVGNNKEHLYYLWCNLRDKHQEVGAMVVVDGRQVQWFGISKLPVNIGTEIIAQLRSQPQAAFLLWGRSPVLHGFAIRAMDNRQWEMVRSQIQHPEFEFDF